jgi:hypothetical protein
MSELAELFDKEADITELTHGSEVVRELSKQLCNKANSQRQRNKIKKRLFKSRVIIKVSKDFEQYKHVTSVNMNLKDYKILTDSLNSLWNWGWPQNPAHGWLGGQSVILWGAPVHIDNTLDKIEYIAE